MKNTIFKAIFFYLITLPMVGAQSSDFGNWMIYFGNKQINNKWNWHHEAQYRNYNAVGDLEQLLLRTGIGYNLTENNNNLLAGYAFIGSRNYQDDISDEAVTVNEHRTYFQFITRQSAGKIRIQHRYRFEQRWIEDTDFKMRFRYFLSVNIPLSNKEMSSKSWYASIYNEIFINNNSTIFDRNRLYGGLGFVVNDMIRLELGYMNQFLNNQNRDQLNIISFINF